MICKSFCGMDYIKVVAPSMVEENTFHVGPLNFPTMKRKDNLKVKAREAAGIVANLRTQVKELEQQRDFLITWKANMYTGVDAESSHVDVEFQGLDGDRIHAHKAILVSFCKLTRVYNIIQCIFKIYIFLKLQNPKLLQFLL